MKVIKNSGHGLIAFRIFSRPDTRIDERNLPHDEYVRECDSFEFFLSPTLADLMRSPRYSYSNDDFSMDPLRNKHFLI